VVQLRKIVEDAQSKSSGANYYNQQQQQQHSYYGAQQQQHKQQQPDDPEVAQLAAACARCEGELEEALEAACQEAVDVSIEGRVLTITTALPSGGDVGDLWAALELAGMEGRHLAWVADLLLQHVLPPVLDGTARFDAHATPNGDSAIVKWLAIPGRPLTPGSVGRVEADCGQLLQVLADALFRRRDSTLAAFGAAFWPRFMELYQHAFMQQLETQGAAVLRGRQRAAAAMEAAARDLGLLAGCAAEPLGAALGRAVQASYHSAQEGLLARARDAAARAGPGAVPVTVGSPLPLDGLFYQRYREGQVKAWEAIDPPCGWDGGGPVLATGFYQVSAAALEVAQVMDDALNDAVAAGGWLSFLGVALGCRGTDLLAPLESTTDSSPHDSPTTQSQSRRRVAGPGVRGRRLQDRRHVCHPRPGPQRRRCAPARPAAPQRPVLPGQPPAGAAVPARPRAGGAGWRGGVVWGRGAAAEDAGARAGERVGVWRVFRLGHPVACLVCPALH
jgi:hypothetical protein